MNTKFKLNRGDTIGFLSPSAGLAPYAMHRVKRAKKYFEDLGYKVKIAKNALKNNGYISASIKERLNDLHELFLDKKVKMIISMIGGNHSNQLIKNIDYSLIAKNPKIFVGYSDITVLHYAIISQAGLNTYYGPCILNQFGEYPKPLEYTSKYFFESLTDNNDIIDIKNSNYYTDEILDWFKKEDLTRARKTKNNSGYKWLKKGFAHGKIIGGTIPSLNHLLGTKYWINPKNKIFFLDIPEGKSMHEGLAISDLDSYLTDLDNVELFKKIRGLIIGKPYHYSKRQNRELEDIIIKFTNRYNYPVLMNANIGHVDPIITIKYNSLAELNSHTNSFKIKK